MKGKTKLKLILIMLVIMAASLIAGCRIGPADLETTLAEGNFTASITYYSNGGTFLDRENDTSMADYRLYYQDDNPVLNITSETRFKVRKTNYVFVRWEWAELDASGNVVYEDAARTTVKSSGNVADLSAYNIQPDEHLSVVAIWTRDVRLDFILVSDAEVTVRTVEIVGDDTNIVDTVYSPGAVIRQQDFGVVTTYTVTDQNPVVTVGSTYVSCYTDPDCTTSLFGVGETYKAIDKPTTGEGNAKVYVKYIAGNWNVVKTASDVSSMLAGTGTHSRYYIFDDIDCNNMSVTPSVSFNYEVEGNGHTISNIAFADEGLANGSTTSIFGSIGSRTNISNLTFSNITFTTSVRAGFANIYLICSQYQTGCTFSNFNLKDITLTIGLTSALIINIPYVGTSYTTTNWIFGGEAGATDADFIVANAGISITNAKLTIAGNDVVTGANLGTQPVTTTPVRMPYYINRKENT